MSQTKRAIGHIARADRDATHKAARHHDEPAVRVAGTLAEVADQPPLIVLSVATALIGLATGRREMVKGGVRMLAAHALATAAKTAIKRSVDRTRPKKALKDGHRFEPGHSHDHDLNSFPSGHLAGAVAVSRAAAHAMPGTGGPAGLATGAVAAAQMPAGNHYLSDMVAGAAIGWAAEALVAAVADRVEPAVERWLADRAATP